MNISIRGDKLEITEAMKTYAKEKLEKLNKYIDSPEKVDANIFVKVRNHSHKIEVTIPLKKFILRAEEEQEDFYAAIDVVMDKLERQIRKNKTRIGSKKIKEAKEFAFEYIETMEAIEDEEELLVKRKIIEVKPMDEEEAILQMELLGHEFYLFKDMDTNKTKLIYKRKDGNYGVIETK